MQADRPSMPVALAMAATLSTTCEKPAPAVAPPPPEVYVQQLWLAQVRGAELRARAELYRTLGGGWRP